MKVIIFFWGYCIDYWKNDVIKCYNRNLYKMFEVLGVKIFNYVLRCIGKRFRIGFIKVVGLEFNIVIGSFVNGRVV